MSNAVLVACEFVTPQEQARLLDVLFDGSQTTSLLVKRFRDAFAPPRYTAVCGKLASLWRQLLYVADGVGVLASLCVIDVMRKGDCVAAASLFCDMLLDLERALRRDLLLAEQIKYASKETKDSSSGGNNNSSSSGGGGRSGEAAHGDVYRMHSAAKLLALQLLADAPLPAEKLTVMLSRRQDALDQALEAWEKSSRQLKEQFAQLTRTQHGVRAQQRACTLLAHAAQMDAPCAVMHSAGVVAPLACAPLPAMPVQHGELHYFVPANPSYALCYSAAATSVPEAYRALRSLLTAACRASLSKEKEHELLQQLSEDAVRHMGIDDVAMRGLALHNAEVCAAVLNRLPASVASAQIQKLLTSDVRDKVDTVLLHAANALDQTNMRTFVTNKLNAFRSKSASMAATDKDALRAFALALHQLLTKAAKDNKQIYLTSDLKRDLEQLFVDSGAPEVVSRWDDMKN